MNSPWLLPFCGNLGAHRMLCLIRKRFAAVTETHPIGLFLLILLVRRQVECLLERRIRVCGLILAQARAAPPSSPCRGSSLILSPKFTNLGSGDFRLFTVGILCAFCLVSMIGSSKTFGGTKILSRALYASSHVPGAACNLRKQSPVRDTQQFCLILFAPIRCSPSKDTSSWPAAELQKIVGISTARDKRRLTTIQSRPYKCTFQWLYWSVSLKGFFGHMIQLFCLGCNSVDAGLIRVDMLLC